MTVKELTEKSGFSPIALPCPDRQIEGVYIGDLLSWVMGKAESGNVWITIMSNINIVAVATLADTSAIVLCEGVMLDSEVAALAESKGVNILSTSHSAYEASKIISGIL